MGRQLQSVMLCKQTQQVKVCILIFYLHESNTKLEVQRKHESSKMKL